MGVVPAAKAGIGSAINDATRELGGTLGVAVIGSVALSVYRSTLDDYISDPAVLTPARDSIGAAMAVGQQTGDPGIIFTAQQAWIDALQIGCWVAAGISVLGFALAAIYLPAHPQVHAEPASEVPPAPAPEQAALEAEPEQVCSECGSPIPRNDLRDRQALSGSTQASSKISASNLV
jgi:hypothetical protein